MKIRKEFLIFGVIIVVIILVICLSMFSDNDTSYEAVQKYISFEEVVQEPEIYYESEIYYEPEDIDDMEESFEVTPSQTESVSSNDYDIEVVYEETPSSESSVLNNDGLNDDILISAVKAFVCNLDITNYEQYMISELIESRDSLLELEPYTTLNSLSSFESELFENNEVKLQTNGVVYSFKLTFTDDGLKISNIEFVE